MEKIFLAVLNMSLTGAFVIAAVTLARLPLKAAPKSISYALWAAAGFRLVFPFSIRSAFALLPFPAAPIPQDIGSQAIPRIDSGITAVDNAVGAIWPAASGVNPLQIWLSVGSAVWLFGMAAMLLYSFVSILLLKRRLRGAKLAEGNLYEADNLKTPFVIGLFRPRIYMPAGLSGEERRYILLHEQTHIGRHDHAVKIFAYLVLCLHWFNPLVWIAFILMGADMEMSCDERVMKKLGQGIKTAYSLSLVRVAAGRRILNGSPLAFGEGGMKERVRNVLNFKRHPRTVVIAAVIFAAAVFALCCVNKGADPPANEPPISANTPSAGDPSGARLGVVPEDLDVPDVVLAAAVDVAKGDYEGYRDIGLASRRDFGAQFDNWRLNYLEHAHTYEDMGIEVYRFEWSIHTTTPDIVRTTLVGGMRLSDDAWLIDTYPASWYLLFREGEDGELVYLFAMMENDCSPGDDIFTNDMLIRWKQNQLMTYLSDLFNKAYTPYYDSLRYEISNYEETETDEGDFTATFLWTMYFTSTKYYDAPSDIGKEQEANFILQATAKSKAAGLLDLDTIEIRADSSAAGPANYVIPIEDFFPGH